MTRSQPPSRKPKLSPNARPRQARAQDTFELILETAGNCLRSVGFEQLTTNMICAAARISPPALYRYFPNKYAVLHELGDRLMRAQDDEVMRWIDAGGLTGPTFAERLDKSIAIHRRMVAIQRDFPGSVSITRALRAVPALQHLRLASRDKVAQHFLNAALGLLPEADRPRLAVAMRMMVELSYAAIEMVIEEPDRDAEIINREVCRLFADYFANF